MPDGAPFQLYVGNQLEWIVPLLLDEMASRGVDLTGNPQDGRFNIPLPVGGAIRGRYRLIGRSVAVRINSRPAAISCGTIKSRLQDFVLDVRARLKNRSGESCHPGAPSPDDHPV